MNDEKLTVLYGFAVLRPENVARITLDPLTWRMVLARAVFAVTQIALLATAVLCFAYVFRH